MLRVIVLFGLITSAFAGESLDPLVNASVGFSMAIQQQLATTRSDPSLIEFVAKTIVYADAKTAYFEALREAAPELMNIATGREARPPWGHNNRVLGVERGHGGCVMVIDCLVIRLNECADFL